MKSNYYLSSFERKKSNRLGIAGMVLGIVGVLTVWAIIGGLFGVIGLILSCVGVTRKGRRKGCAVAGIVLGALSILIFIGILILIPSNNSSQVPVTIPNPRSGNAYGQENDTDYISAIGETVFHTGEPANYQDIQISLLGYSESEGTAWLSPDEGYIFVYPEIEIVNNSDKEISVNSIISFECYCDDYKMNFSASALMAAAGDDSFKQLSGSVIPGKKMKGTLGLEVPSDWKRIEIYYRDDLWADCDFGFLIEK